MERWSGAVEEHTIKDGIVVENARLMEEVERMVAESKEEGGENPVFDPFTAKEE